jgi:hypothetical protein
VTDSPARILAERRDAMDKVVLALAAEHGLPSGSLADVPARQHWRLVEEAEARYRRWQVAIQSSRPPVMRSKTDIALANLYGIDHG